MTHNDDRPTLFLSATDAATDAETTRSTLLKDVASLLATNSRLGMIGATPEYAVRTTVLPLFPEPAPARSSLPPGVEVNRGAYQRIEQAIFLAADRYYSRLHAANSKVSPSSPSATSKQQPARSFGLKNVKAHVVHGGDALAYEMAHTSSDHVGVSGVYCLQATELEDHPAGSQMMFFDPRNGLSELHPLPYHMGSRGGGDGNPYFWTLYVCIIAISVI